MKSRIATIAVMLTLVAMTSGCRNTKDVARQSQPQEQSEAVESTSTCPHQYMTRTFACSAAGYNANGLIRMECEKAIWVSITKGLELGRVKMTPDSAWIHVKLLNCAWKGDYSDLKQLTKTEYYFDTLMNQLIYKPEAAEESISKLGRSFNIPVSVKMNELKGAAGLNFPMNIPANAKPLKIILSQ